ncbi:MAG: AI-2E family transporter [Chitinophagaceae bacterium]|nr:MAG: AI-2E family transporter [Chitinophagaceae bacterium]
MLFYAQAGIVAVAVLYFAKGLLIPMSYGLLLSVVLFPLCKKLEKNGWSRTSAIAATLTLVMALFTMLLALLIVEVNMFSKDLPSVMTKLQVEAGEFERWVNKHFGIALTPQNEWKALLYNLVANSSGVIKNTLYATAGTLVTLFLVPVYTALFLYNRHLFVRFLVNITPVSLKEQLPRIIERATATYSQFIKGMLFVYIIVAVSNSLGLLILGIEHAILFGILTALMTVIPYVGIIISSMLPITVAWLTKDSIWYPVGVIAILSFVQYLEANIIFPKLVGTQINVSTWATLVAIIAGGMLWGISGMILFIPFLGIAKIIFEQFPAGRTFNILLARSEKTAGDEAT